MEGIKVFLLTLVGLSVFLGIGNMIIPKKTMAGPVKLLMGLIMLLTLLSPFTRLFSSFSWHDINTAAFSGDISIETYQEKYNNQLLAMAGEGIKQDINEYFLENYEITPIDITVTMEEYAPQEYGIETLIIYLDWDFGDPSELKKQLEARYAPVYLEIRSV